MAGTVKTVASATAPVSFLSPIPQNPENGTKYLNRGRQRLAAAAIRKAEELLGAPHSRATATRQGYSPEAAITAFLWTVHSSEWSSTVDGQGTGLRTPHILKWQDFLYMSNGTLRLTIMRNPFDGDSFDTTKGDHHTDLEISDDEWAELFFSVLQVPKNQEFIDGEDTEKYNERQEVRFKRYLKTKGYPMLGRIWNMYRDANYLSTENNQLLEECLKLQKKPENVHALSALGKLIAACYEATKSGSGLAVISD